MSPARVNRSVKHYTWQPGIGPDAAALARLRSHFPRPSEPMGEAWFMGERRMFPELMDGIDRLPASALEEPLVEIASGSGSFGQHEEWTSWYRYLLAQLIPRAHERVVLWSLLESLVTGFFALYPTGVHDEPYEGFREDVLATLGRCVMEPTCWSGNDVVVGAFLRRSNDNPRGVWLWDDVSGDLSASLFLCLKFLPAELVSDWFRSVLAIESPYWRAQLMAWLLGASDTLVGRVAWPSEWKTSDSPSIGWNWSHCLRAGMASIGDDDPGPRDHFIPADSRASLLATARNFFTADVYLAWLESIDARSELAEETAWIPLAFERIYVP